MNAERLEELVAKQIDFNLKAQDEDRVLDVEARDNPDLEDLAEFLDHKKAIKDRDQALDLLLLMVGIEDREGWEVGPTEGEVTSAAWDFLSNFGRDPGHPNGQAKLERLRKDWPQ